MASAWQAVSLTLSSHEGERSDQQEGDLMAVGVTAMTTGATGLLRHRGAGDGAPAAGTRGALPLQSSSLKPVALHVPPSTFPLDTTHFT